MFEGILPRSIDNAYRGRKVALWLLGFLVFIKSVIGVNSIVNGADVMTKADGIALNTFPAAAAQNLIALWALLGLGHIIMAVLGALVLIRYRGMAPLLFALLLLSHLGGRVVGYFHPSRQDRSTAGVHRQFCAAHVDHRGLSAVAMAPPMNQPRVDAHSTRFLFSFAR